MANTEARLDKWLWAARIYKTRTLAADACKNGRITINGSQAKPARTVKAGRSGCEETAGCLYLPCVAAYRKTCRGETPS